MKRAYLVLGPESSATRLTTHLLIAAGCYGDETHHQRLDEGLVDVPLVAWRRSVPHMGEIPDIEGMIERLLGRGYDVTAVITSRDWHAMIMSQVASGHAGDEEAAVNNIRLAYRLIFQAISAAEIPFVISNYEALVARPREAASELLLLLGLNPGEIPRIFDGNAKHYGEWILR